MLKAKDIMTRDVITLTPETDIVEAARVLLTNRINGAPVLDGEKLVGVICQADLVATQKRLSLPSLFTTLDGFIPLGSMSKFEREMEKIAALNVKEAMTPDPRTVSPEDDLELVAKIMVDDKLHTLPVVEDGRLVGVIGKEDILTTFLEKHS